MASNPIFAILWLALLFFIGWPAAIFCAGFWIILQVRSFIHSFVALRAVPRHA
jgi:hypothetical protein